MKRRAWIAMSVASVSFLGAGCGKVLGFQDDSVGGKAESPQGGGENGGAAAGTASAGHAGVPYEAGGASSGSGGASVAEAGDQGTAAAAGAADAAGAAGSGGTAGVGGSSSSQGGVSGATGGGGAGGAGGTSGACHGHTDMVSVGSFCIDKTEVTRQQYRAFAISPIDPSTVDSCHWKTAYAAGEVGPLDFALPAGDVDWCDAKAYCQWAGKRLCGKVGGGALLDEEIYTSNPDTDEWYRVCTQNGATKYPYGNVDDPTRCNFSDVKVSAATDYPLCTTPEGVVELLGNVFEWENACKEGATSDPKQVMCRHRGGSAFSGDSDCNSGRSQVRSFTAPDLGFRCCSD